MLWNSPDSRGNMRKNRTLSNSESTTKRQAKQKEDRKKGEGENCNTSNSFYILTETLSVKRRKATSVYGQKNGAICKTGIK